MVDLLYEQPVQCVATARTNGFYSSGWKTVPIYTNNGINAVIAVISLLKTNIYKDYVKFHNDTDILSNVAT